MVSFGLRPAVRMQAAPLLARHTPARLERIELLRQFHAGAVVHVLQRLDHRAELLGVAEAHVLAAGLAMRECRERALGAVLELVQVPEIGPESASASRHGRVGDRPGGWLVALQLLEMPHDDVELGVVQERGRARAADALEHIAVDVVIELELASQDVDARQQALARAICVRRRPRRARMAKRGAMAGLHLPASPALLTTSTISGQVTPAPRASSTHRAKASLASPWKLRRPVNCSTRPRRWHSAASSR